MARKENKTLEESFTRLEEIVLAMEAGDKTIDENFKLYKEGIELIKSCNTKLDKVEKDISLINDNGEITQTNGEF